MRIKYPWKCDGCNSEKGESNHWFMLMPDHTNATLYTGPSEYKSVYGFLLIAWDQSLADVKGVEHYCSEKCCLDALSKWLATQQDLARKAAGQ